MNLSGLPISIPNILPVNNVRLNDHQMDEGYSSDEARRKQKREITSKAQEDCANEQAYIRCKWQKRAVEVELVYRLGKDEPGHELCGFMLAGCQRAYGMLKSELYRPDAVS